MLNRLDIACLFDREWLDGAGDRRTYDRSRRGIHPLVGDGTTPGTQPTWDATRGLYTFDGNDYFALPQVDDVADVLADMASIQDESFFFLFENFEYDAGNPEWIASDSGANPFFFIRHRTAAGDIQWRIRDAVGNTEEITTAAGTMPLYDGKQVLFTCVRTTDSQTIYADEAILGTATSTSRDGSSDAKDINIGRDPGGFAYLPSGTGLKFFGYGRFLATAMMIRQLRRGFRSML